MIHPTAFLVPACLLGLLPTPAGLESPIAFGQEIVPAPQVPTAETSDAAVQRADFAREYGILEGDEIDPIGGEILNRALQGKKLPASAWGELRIETMADVLEREKSFVQSTTNPRIRNGRQGEWQVPSRKIKSHPHGGVKCLINRWGDTSMGIGLGETMDVEDVWIASQGGMGIWAKAVRVVGYRAGEEVAATEWFTDIDHEPSLMTIGLRNVDRIVFEAKPGHDGAGFYAIDDLRFVKANGEAISLGFEEASWDQRLTESGFAGFTWETGTGSFDSPKPGIVPAPGEGDGSSRQSGSSPAGYGADDADATLSGSTTSSVLGGSGTAPTFLQEFVGPRLGDNGANLIPPDTCGAVGVNHFVALVNSNLSVYDKSGNRQQSVSLQSFFGSGGGTVGDPRVAYDFTHDRWCAIATNFGELCWFAYSLTGDPLGAWVKTSIDLVQGSDNGRWVDYPTLGVDSRGIFIEAYMVGSPARMTIFAIDKAPLLAASPALGTVTAFRGLNWDGAIQHATQYNDAGQSYMISTRTSNTFRLRRIDPPLTNPTLTTSQINGIPNYGSANDAPALGSTVNINTGGTRLMNACYAGSSIWAAHTVAAGGKSGARWYQIDPVALSVTQSGTLTDPSLWFYYPTIAADANGNAVMGFSGSDANTYPSAYYSGRLGTDAAGEMSTAVLYSAGQNSYTITDGAGRNRWGDYSQTSLDPVDGSFWTIQERTRNQANSWVTRIAQVEYGNVCGGITRYCSAVTNPTGVAAIIDTFGTSSVGANDLVLYASNLPLSTFGIFFYGQNQASAAVGDGTLCINNPFFRLAPVQASLFGDVSYALDLTAQSDPAGQIMIGETWNFSFWYRQVSPSGFNFSDALSVEFCD
ncbi:hypothetical protein Poly30_56170 [Planctomycetes bacterium Poly30]|uniref:Uncharacterized protein n=1 Tax=Saltatorellus ferox TaxID=2528018 RepID=A0A518F145_9BACT|nr:hypothetical protein Poly30_56170 [Planctomycetes bacterium Poly30]